jgi:DNA (cytosine-5)-methyltransferase 1
MIPKAKSYFTGGGLMNIGMEQAGVEITQSLEIDAKAVQCMQNNPKYFSHKILHRDIRDITVLEQDQSDIMIGTYPCNKYSPISQIHGQCVGDDLFLHYFRHVAIEQPEMYIVENVPGMKKFPIVMEAMTKLPNYYVNIFCPLDANLWLPQRRERLILIGTKKPFHISAPKKAKRPVRLKDIIEKNAEYRITKAVIARLKGKYRDLPIISDPANNNEIAPTCVAHYAKDLSTRLVKDASCKYGARPYTIREYARLQGVPDDMVFENEPNAYRIIGNGVAVDMARWVGQQAMKYFN